jgi:hypothetical protein
MVVKKINGLENLSAAQIEAILERIARLKRTEWVALIGKMDVLKDHLICAMVAQVEDQQELDELYKHASDSTKTVIIERLLALHPASANAPLSAAYDDFNAEETAEILDASDVEGHSAPAPVQLTRDPSSLAIVTYGANRGATGVVIDPAYVAEIEQARQQATGTALAIVPPPLPVTSTPFVMPEELRARRVGDDLSVRFITACERGNAVDVVRPVTLACEYNAYEPAATQRPKTEGERSLKQRVSEFFGFNG